MQTRKSKWLALINRSANQRDIILFPILAHSVIFKMTGTPRLVFGVALLLFLILRVANEWVWWRKA